MKKFLTVALVAAVALVGSVVAPKSAEAVPAFARQMDVSCYTCHFQYIPKLNAFGRAFKLGGFTQTSQELIEDEDLSIPPVMNLGFIMKYRYRKFEVNRTTAAVGPAVGTERGQLEFYDESAVWIAGRLGENWGLAIEFPGPVLSSKIVYSNDFGGVQGGLFFYQTDALGAAWGMEPFNTGAARNHRMFENRGATAIQQRLGGPSNASGATLGNGDTGIGIFASSDLFFLNVSLFGPGSSVNGGSTIDTNLELSQYIRLALTPKLADGVDLMVGLQVAAGQTRLSGTGVAGAAIATAKTNSTAIDFQVQMDDFNGMSLEVVGAYIVNPNDNNGANTNEYNTDDTDDESGFSIGASLGVTHAFGVKLAYLTADTPKGVRAVATVADATDGTNNVSATTVGMWYDFAQNVAFIAEYSSFTGTGHANNNELYLMLEIGF